MYEDSLIKAALYLLFPYRNGSPSVVTSSFGGILQNEVNCLICGTESRKFDPFLGKKFVLRNDHKIAKHFPPVFTHYNLMNIAENPFFVVFTQISLWTFPVSSDKREVRTRSRVQLAPYVVISFSFSCINIVVKFLKISEFVCFYFRLFT